MMGILVVGDIMIDRWRECEVVGVSPEAPCLDLREVGVRETLGGAGNVAMNLASLGVDVGLYGVLGDDADGKRAAGFMGLIEPSIGIVVNTQVGRVTTVKERITVGRRQVSRFSREDLVPISSDIVGHIHRDIAGVIGGVDLVIVSDYNKGVCTPELIRLVKGICEERGIPLFVDPKYDNLWHYRDAMCIKFNEREYGRFRDGFPESEHGILGCGFMVVTRGAGGCDVYYGSGSEVKMRHFSALQVDVSDATGAGDVFMAVLAYEYVRTGGDVLGSVEVANHAAGISVQHSGTYIVKLEDLVVDKVGGRLLTLELRDSMGMSERMGGGLQWE